MGTFVVSSVRTVLVFPVSTWGISLNLLSFHEFSPRATASIWPNGDYTLQFLKPTGIICAKMCFAQSAFKKKKEKDEEEESGSI